MTTLSFAGGTAGATYTVPGTHIGYGVWKYPGAANDQVYASSGTFAQMVDAAVITSNFSGSTVLTWGGTAASSEAAICVINSSQTGWSAVFTGTTVLLRKEVAGSGGTTITAAVTSGLTTAGDYTIDWTWNPTTGAITVSVAGVQKTTGAYTDNLTNMRGGLQNYNANSAHTFKSLTTTQAATTSVTLTTPVAVGGTGYSLSSTGLSTITSLTNATITGTSTNAANYSMNAWQNNVVYLAVGTNKTQTASDGTLTASGTITLNSQSGYTTVDMASIDRGNWSVGKDTNIQNGDQVSLPTAAGTLNANGTLTDYTFGTYTMWRRDVSDGKMYTSTLTVSNSGVSVGKNKRPFIGIGIGI